MVMAMTHMRMIMNSSKMLEKTFKFQRMLNLCRMYKTKKIATVMVTKTILNKLPLQIKIFKRWFNQWAMKFSKMMSIKMK